MNIQEIQDAQIEKLKDQVQAVLQGQDRVILQRHETERQMNDLKEQVRQCAHQLGNVVGGLSLNLRQKAQFDAVILRMTNLQNLV
jgi:hypothetical protein